MPAMRRLAAFMYHEVTDLPETTGFQRLGARAYAVSSGAFERHLDLIAAIAGAPARLDDALDDALEAPGTQGAGTPPRVLLTFDDGGRSARHAADRLERRGWFGHFFIVTGRIGSRGFVTRDDLRALHAAGHLVGSHSVTHPDIFRDLSRRRMREEWRRSRETLEHVVGAPCVVGSIPGGDLSEDVARAAAEAGIPSLFTSEPWLRPRHVAGCLLLGRFAIKNTLADPRFASLLHGEGWTGALVRRRATVLVRRSFAPLYRLYVRHRTAGDRTTVLA